MQVRSIISKSHEAIICYREMKCCMNTCCGCYSTYQDWRNGHHHTPHSSNIWQDFGIECRFGRQHSLKIHLPGDTPKDQQQHSVNVYPRVLGVDGLDPQGGCIDWDIPHMGIGHGKWNGYPLKIGFQNLCIHFFILAKPFSLSNRNHPLATP